MRIRKIRESDVAGIARIMHKIMGPKDAKAVMNDLKDTLAEKEYSPFKFENFYVMEIKNSIVGCGGVWALKHDPHVARLDWFMVDPDYQRKGIGTMLMKFIQNFLMDKKVKLILAETSGGKEYKAAVTFWKKNGFKEIAKIPDYWEDGSSCIYFVKRL